MFFTGIAYAMGAKGEGVITSYSIHYTKLYEPTVHGSYSPRGAAPSVCGRGRRLAALALLLWVAAAWVVGSPLAAAPGPVMVATISSSINPVTADFLSSAIERAEEEKAVLLVLELDTPGGLDTAMRQMVQERNNFV